MECLVGEAAGPEPVDVYAEPIIGRRRIVGPLQFYLMSHLLIFIAANNLRSYISDNKSARRVVQSQRSEVRGHKFCVMKARIRHSRVIVVKTRIKKETKKK